MIDLGLATVLGCVRIHRLVISVSDEFEREPDLRIPPRSSDLDPEDAVEGFGTDRPPTGNGHILVVDDEVVVREIVSEGLENLGYRVSLCHDGLEAVEFYRREGDAVDLVILDLIMPRMNGSDAFGAIRKINPLAKVLLSSGFSEGSESRELLEQGALGFLVKPFTIADLADEVHRVLNLR